MARVKKAGQAGNIAPLQTAASSDVVNLDYQLGFRRPIVQSTAAALTVHSSQSGALICYGGRTCGAITITLPAPEPGLWFETIATGAICSAGTIITCASTDAFIVKGTSAGVGTIQAEATDSEFTKAAGGLFTEFYGVSTSRYAVRQYAGGSTTASTAQFKPAS